MLKKAVKGRYSVSENLEVPDFLLNKHTQSHRRTLARDLLVFSKYSKAFSCKTIEKAMIFLALWLAFIPFLSDARAQDTLRGRFCLECEIRFHVNRTDIDLDLGGNRSNLDSFGSALETLSGKPYLKLQQIKVIGAASPEGGSALNRRLASMRSRALYDWLRNHTGYTEIDTLSIGADWEGFWKILESGSALSEICDSELFKGMRDANTPSMFTGELRTIDDGKLWRYLKSSVLPRLRESRCIACFYAEQLPGLPSSPVQRLASPSLYAEMLPPVSKSASKEEERSFRPFLALKTNILPWAGVNSLFRIKNSMLNGAAELYFAQRWSVEANALYSKWPTFNKKKFWGVCSYGVEPRFWLRKDGSFKGFFVGAFFNSGEFDDQQERNFGLDNRTGTFWGAGIIAGYLLPVTRHWAVEVGLKGGYRRSESEWYEIEWVGDVKHHWYDHTTHEGGFLPGVKLNVVYRFGKPNR